MKKPKKHYKLSIFLLVFLLLIGGTLIAGLIILQLQGKLAGMIQKAFEFINAGGVYGTLMLFWILLIPILLIILLVINVKRRGKFKEVQNVWQEAMKIAIEQEMAARAAEEAEREKLPDPRFGLLNHLDGRTPFSGSANSEGISSLEELCERFRAYSASQLGLYYSITDIREFISSLAVSRIIILQGLSGTGKTSLAYAFGEFLGNPSTIIPVQPMWKERTDLLGYYNEFTRKFNETVLLQAMYEANRSDGIFITVLDELNIARVEYYFAEFLSLLEIPNPESRYLEIVPDVWKNDPQGLKDGRIKLPENMWFIGTANNDDSTFAISDKVYDRAMVLNMNRKADRSAYTGAFGSSKKAAFTVKQFEELVSEVRERYELTNRNERRLQTLDEYLIEKFQISFGNRIMKQIRSYISVYVSCGGEELDALDDILCKKVFRKLEAQNLAYVKSEAENLCDFMDELFGGRLKRCREYIQQFVRAM